MADSLTKYGVYIDDLSKIRVLEPEAANQTNKLKEECQSFVSSKSRCVAFAGGVQRATRRIYSTDRHDTHSATRSFLTLRTTLVTVCLPFA